MSRTFKDIKKQYLSPAQQLERSHYGLCSGCEWCTPAINRVRSSELRNAIKFEIDNIDFDSLSDELQSAILKFRNK